MELMHERCAGLDVHKDEVVACVRVVDGGEIRRELRAFGTTTAGLLELHDWLEQRQITHVAMEATGVYWKPVWHILESDFALVLANAAHVRNVPGRKSDANDATWIAELLAHGLVRASFVPPTEIQDLRALTRTRKQLTREITQHTHRIQKTLEDANLKLSSVIADTVGKSGRAILRAIIAGETEPEKLLQHARRRLKAPREQLLEALRGSARSHHRFLLRLHLDQIEALEAAVVDVEARIALVLAPFRQWAELLKTIPGVSDTVAHAIIAEIGVDMSRFPTSGHLISWAGLCPGLHESAGKRRSTRIRRGAPWLKTLLVQAAWGASRKKGSYLRAQFHRLKGRRGAKKAIVAVAASILTAVYHMLRDGCVYADLGGDHFDRRDNKARVAQRLARRIEALGYHVDLREAA
jgi:transposase